MPTQGITSIDQHPGYREAREKKRELEATHSAALQKRDKLQIELSRATHSKTSLDVAASQLLEGIDVVPDDVVVNLREEYREARKQVEIVERALSMHAQCLRKHANQAGREVCTTLFPEYKKRIAAIARLVDELEQAAIEVLDFEERLGLEIESITHKPVPPIQGAGFALLFRSTERANRGANLACVEAWRELARQRDYL